MLIYEISHWMCYVSTCIFYTFYILEKHTTIFTLQEFRVSHYVFTHTVWDLLQVPAGNRKKNRIRLDGPDRDYERSGCVSAEKVGGDKGHMCCDSWKESAGSEEKEDGKEEGRLGQRNKNKLCLKNVTMKPFFISQYKLRYSWKGDDIHNWRSQELSMLRFQLVIESLYVLKLSVIPSTAHNNIYSTHKLTTIDLEGWSTCTNLVTIVTGVGDGIGNIWNVSLFSN